jgi:hypothetical protein
VGQQLVKRAIGITREAAASQEAPLAHKRH